MPPTLTDTSTWTDHQPVSAEPRNPATPVADVGNNDADGSVDVTEAAPVVVRPAFKRVRRVEIPEGQFLSGFCANTGAVNAHKCPGVIKNGSMAPFPFVTCICACHTDDDE